MLTAPSAALRPEGAARLLPDRATAARDLEAAFLTVLLREAGYGAPRASFGGGLGEEQVSSMLCDEQARLIAEAGGIGLAARFLSAGAMGGDDG
ncbi:rod-binding protein [Frigidibacter sp. MR17.14]|uniref:rod-binding protein n=1 Tax=Frigidibacter sp. MR17.14 TaxID=3126509 RepID=UPI003012AB2A